MRYLKLRNNLVFISFELSRDDVTVTWLFKTIIKQNGTVEPVTEIILYNIFILISERFLTMIYL